MLGFETSIFSSVKLDPPITDKCLISTESLFLHYKNLQYH